MTRIIQNMAGLIGSERLLRLLNTAVKQNYQVSRPFITIVIEQDGNATVHSNMDVAAERVSLLEQTVTSLKSLQN